MFVPFGLGWACFGHGQNQKERGNMTWLNRKTVIIALGIFAGHLGRL